MDNALTTMNLSKSYGTNRVLVACYMHVPDQAIYRLTGGPGAGKTTLLRVLCGLQRPTTGTYMLHGARAGTDAMRRARKHFGALIGEPALAENLSAADNLRLSARLLSRKSEVHIRGTLELVGLADAGRQKAQHLPHEARQRLGLACVLVGSPDFVILDEPELGLDPAGISELAGIITRLNRERGITFLVAGRPGSALARIATCHGFLADGRLVQEMNAEDLAQAVGLRGCGLPAEKACALGPTAAAVPNIPMPAALRPERELPQREGIGSCIAHLLGGAQ